jgi:predicted branched-subunit amino acid permease
VSISLAVAPFGLAFGVICSRAGLSLIQAVGFSTLVFTGSAQFAAVSVLEIGGTVAAAVVAGVLLNLRSLAFGVIMAPSLHGPVWWRALVAQLMIDESTAVGSAQADPASRRFGYLAGGIGVFLTWNLSTAAGALFGTGSGDAITRLGIDATIPAAFLALVWPRLSGDRARQNRIIALSGAGLAVATSPILPPGLPILVAALASLMARPWRRP